MSRHLSLFALAGLLLAALACNKAETTPTVARPMATRPGPTSTLTASPAPPAVPTTPKPAPSLTPSPTPRQVSPTTSATGSLSGKVCYPGSAIPRMSIYAVDQATRIWYQVKTFRSDETAYRIEGIAPGTYVVYAWLEDGKLGGSYSKAVPCGLSVDCQDHTLITVTIQPGQNVTGADVCDWYGPPPPAPPK